MNQRGLKGVLSVILDTGWVKLCCFSLFILELFDEMPESAGESGFWFPFNSNYTGYSFSFFRFFFLFKIFLNELQESISNVLLIFSVVLIFRFLVAYVCCSVYYL